MTADLTDLTDFADTLAAQADYADDGGQIDLVVG